MKDKYNSLSELQSKRPNSFSITHKKKKSTFLIFTPHGGGIEPGTTELCEWFGQNSFSYYCFSGAGKKCKDLHITSARFDEPRLLHLLGKHKQAISFHGMTDYMKRQYSADIFLGGLDLKLLSSISRKLRDNGFSVATSIQYPRSILAASNLNNVTNRCISKQGVQIELSEHLRRKFFMGDFKLKKGRKKTTEKFEFFCILIKEVLNTF